MRPAHTVAALALCMLLAACATSPGAGPARAEFVAQQKAEAKRLEAADRPAQALAVWRTLLPLGKPDAETAAAIASLESRIDKEIGDRLAAGSRAYRAGNVRQGDSYMLQVLALRPGQPDALENLAKTTSQRARAQQRSKSDLENRNALARRATAAPTTHDRLQAMMRSGDHAGMVALGERLTQPVDARNAGLLRSAHIALADEAEARGDDDQALAHLQDAMTLSPQANDPLVDRSLALRGKLSRYWFEQGSRLMSSDLDAAIAALQQSLDYNPYNDNAKRKLAQAEVLQRNLQRIEGSR